MAIVFVNYHSEGLIVPTAERLRNDGFFVAVADNSASYPSGGADVVVPGTNEGFGAGCNRAVGSLGGDIDVVCFHNPDVKATTSTLLQMEAGLRKQWRPGILAPSERVGNRVRTTGYHYPTAGRELLLGTRALSRLAFPRRPHRSSGSRGRAGPGPPLGQRGRRFPAAALLAVHREAFEDVGGFDERYFLYGEDLDLWHRIRNSGRVTVIRPDLVVDHLWAQGSPLDAARREVLRWLGVELFAESSGDRWRPMRASHRLLLSPMARHCPDLAEAVDALWRVGATPAETLDGLRLGLVSGRLLE